MRTKALLFSSLFIVMFCVCIGQQTPVQMIPPPPTAYSLGKYGDIPVSLYTGVPNISVPIYKLNNHDVSVDVSLSYHGGGVKVDEIASFVGLGWSLNAGGVITRVVRGVPEGLWSDGSFFHKRSDIAFYNYSTNPPKDDFVTNNDLYGATSGMNDPEPDVFYFNFMGKSGKFYFDKTGKTILEKNEGLDIKWNYTSSGERFVVTDEIGIIYEFYNYETTFISGVNQNIITGWYLSKVTSPTGNQITFEYTGGASSTQKVRSYSTSFVDLYQGYNSITPPINAPYIGSSYSEIRLLKILSETGSVEFNYKNQLRQDYPPGVLNIASEALEEILIKKPDGGLLKKYKLGTSYFEANNIRKYDGMTPSDYIYLNYRLRLDNVAEYSSDGASQIPPYTFIYYGDNDPTTDDAYTLPYRLSPGQDHWGFYNKAPNTHMIPGLSASKSIKMPFWYHQFIPHDFDEYIFTSISGGANRDVDTGAVKAGMLKEMHYPTGGYTEFVFEANAYSNNIGGARIGKIISYPVSGQSKETDYTYEGSSLYNPKDYYFEYYRVSYFAGGDGTSEIRPSPTILNVFGVPYDPNFYANATKNLIKVSVQPQAILGPGSQVGYSSVNEFQPGNGGTLSIFESHSYYPDFIDRDSWSGTTPDEVNKLDKLFVSEYIDPNWYQDYPFGVAETQALSSKEWPYPEIYSNEWKRGQLTDRYTGTSSKVLKEEHFTYSHELKDVIPGWKVIAFQTPSGGGIRYLYSEYLLPHTLSQLQSTITTTYDNNGLNPLTDTTNYFYDNNSHLQLTRTESRRSNGKKENSLTTYPLDYVSGTTFIDDMKTNHLLAYPIEQVKYLDNGTSKNIVSGTITTYKTGGKGLKDTEVKLETASPIALSSFKFSNRATGILPPAGSATTYAANSFYKPILNYNSYDSKSNLTSVSKENDIKTVYLWGYNKSYPVAQVSGSDYSTVSAFVNQNILDNPADEATLINELNKIRSGLAATGALLTTYTYKPLAGITSQTDPNGRTTYYEYDNFSRLNLIRDQNKNIIKKFCYSYAGQPVNCDGVVYNNVLKQTTFTRNNCGSGYVGGSVIYTVNANTYKSIISQVDADQQAQNDINTNGQNYANANGTCTIPANINVTFTNTTAAYVDLQLTNTATNAIYSFSLYANTNTATVVGQIPEGNYNVTMTSNTNLRYTYTVYNYTLVGVSTYQASNLSLCTSCASVSISN